MLIIGTGSREYRSPHFIREKFKIIRAKYNMTEYYHGSCKGFDLYSDFILRSTGFTNIRKFDADWNRHGKAAGNIRNEQMLIEGLTHYDKNDIVVVAFPLESSVGTLNMIEMAQLRYICVEVFEQ